jgi:hypothetical protein
MLIASKGKKFSEYGESVSKVYQVVAVSKIKSLFDVVGAL